MELILNIYKQENKREIEKTYTADTYDLMYGTLEDLVNSIDLDAINAAKGNDGFELGKMVLRLLPQIKPLLRDMFDGLTAEEIRRAKVKEIVPVFVEAFKYAFAEIKGLDGGNNSGN